MTDLGPLRVFIASPGDLARERGLVKSTIERYNTSRRREGERRYKLLGWEHDKRGSARRPQDEINELIAESEFMIVLFKAAWGSDPGSPFGYTSGTEEELFTGLLQLGEVERPLEDIWVGFVDDPNPAREIAALRTQLEQRHALRYESIADDLELDRKLSDRLEGWQETAGTKTARHFDLRPQSGRNMLGAAKLRHEGESFIRLGRADLGLEKLRAAADVGGPTEYLAYARVLGRRGLLEEALAQTSIAIEMILDSSVELNSTLAGDAFVTEAGILRRKGADLEAINRLGMILGELDHRAGDSWRVRARILDERALAYQRLDRLRQASADLASAHELRRQHGRSVDVAQSLVNLVRLKVRQGEKEVANTYADEMLNILEGTTPSALHANVWTAVAQLRLRQGVPDEGIPFGLQALRLNEQMGSTSGIAKSLLVLTQCARAAGHFDDSREYGERCIEVNESMDNEQGASLARWQMEQLPPADN